MKRIFYALLFFTAVTGLVIPLTLVAQDSSTETKRAFPTVQETTRIYLPAVVNRYDPQFPAPLFGVQTYGNNGPASPYHPYLVGSQSRWVRSRISWEQVEPTNRSPQEFIWTGADAAVAAAWPENGGLHLIVVLGEGLPEWSRLLQNRPHGPIHADTLPDFAEFVQTLVERYDGDGYQDAPGQPVIKHWEFINEPDKKNESWGEYPAEYFAALSVFYEAVKAADPSAQVALGGLAYDWFEAQGGPFNESFLDDVLEAGGGDYFDIMNFHIYPLFAPVWGSESTGLKEKTAVLRDKLATYGLDKPVIITEAGWHTSTNTYPASSSDEQVARLLQLFVQSYANDIKVMIWWMLYDPGGYFPDFGLVTDDVPPVPKDSYVAYQTAYDLLGNTWSVRTLTAGETGATNMEAYSFQSAQETVYVAWLNPYQTTETKPLRIRATQAVRLDALGNQIGPVVVDDNGDGYVIIHITNHPIYIQVN